MDHVSSCTYITKAKYYFITIESRITIRCEIRFELRVVVGLIFYFRFILNFLLLDFRFELLIWFNKRENRISLHIYSFSWLYWNMASFHSLAFVQLFDKNCWCAYKSYAPKPLLLMERWNVSSHASSSSVVLVKQFTPPRLITQSKSGLSGIKTKFKTNKNIEMNIVFKTCFRW